MLKFAEGVIFSNEIRHIQKDESQFCKACALRKQHKVDNKKLTTNQAIKVEVCLYANLFRVGDTL